MPAPGLPDGLAKAGRYQRDVYRDRFGLPPRIGEVPRHGRRGKAWPRWIWDCGVMIGEGLDRGLPAGPVLLPRKTGRKSVWHDLHSHHMPVLRRRAVASSRCPDGRGGATIAGDHRHPANHGRLCSKGAALGQTLSLEGPAAASEIDGRRASLAARSIRWLRGSATSSPATDRTPSPSTSRASC